MVAYLIPCVPKVKNAQSEMVWVSEVTFQGRWPVRDGLALGPQPALTLCFLQS